VSSGSPGAAYGLLAAVLLWLAACEAGAPGDGPYLEFAGGGFIFNYRLATADYGFVAQVKRKLPAGSTLEARFEDPAGGPPIVIRETAVAGRTGYTFRTPALHGVVTNREYQVELRVLDAASGLAIATYRNSYHSDVDQSVLPAAPTVVGPGYQRPPPSGPAQPATARP